MKPIGFVDQLTRSYVTGWAANEEDLTSPVTVAIFIDGRGCGTVRADRFRQGLSTLWPGATGKYEFHFYFPRALSLYHRHKVSIKVVGSDHSLTGANGQIRGLSTFVIEAINHGTDVEQYRPHGPVLVSTLGRSGSTALMRTLSQHPDIIVAGERPFEVEMACYYAYALYVLLSEGDYERSLRPDLITAVSDRYQIGFNPYFEPSVGKIFKDQNLLHDFLNTQVPRRLIPAFRAIILDYYESVAKDQQKKGSTYFAEKVLPEQDARFGIRAMFPNTKEIVLVRDARDAMCSFMASGGLTFAQARSNAESAALRYLEIQQEENLQTHFVRYEDYVLDQANVMGRVLDFLELSGEATDDLGAMSNLFQVHGTSVSPEASIGRWRRDLSSEQLSQLDGLTEFLVKFGYDT